jgi:hypothetical protein
MQRYQKNAREKKKPLSERNAAAMIARSLML